MDISDFLLMPSNSRNGQLCRTDLADLRLYVLHPEGFGSDSCLSHSSLFRLTASSMLERRDGLIFATDYEIKVTMANASCRAGSESFFGRVGMIAACRLSPTDGQAVIESQVNAARVWYWGQRHFAAAILEAWTAMSNSISENLIWRPIAGLPAAFPEIGNWILLWSPSNCRSALCPYGTDTRDLVSTADHESSPTPNASAVRGLVKPASVSNTARTLSASPRSREPARPPGTG